MVTNINLGILARIWIIFVGINQQKNWFASKNYRMNNLGQFILKSTLNVELKLHVIIIIVMLIQTIKVFFSVKLFRTLKNRGKV